MKLNRKYASILLVVLIALLAAVAVVSAADSTNAPELSGLAHTIAAADLEGVEGEIRGPVQGKVHLLIRPWAPDTDRPNRILMELPISGGGRMEPVNRPT